MSSLIGKIKELVVEGFAETKNNREYLHQYPELSFKEFETSKYVHQLLVHYGIPEEDIEVKCDTGIIAHIKGLDPDRKTIALRADLDALPITEANDVPYKSKHEGIMHACGHDAHTACLLGAAKVLNKLKNEFHGTIKLVFQPGEERIPGGASLLLKEGVFKNAPNAIFGQHVYPELPAGKIGIKPGMYMASADEIYITVNGRGGHGALPNKNIDPVLISAHIITSLQQIVSRAANPKVPTVLSIGKVIANGATNIIPDSVTMEGTFRTMNEDWRYQSHELIKRTVKGLAESMGGSAEVDIHVGYPFLENDVELTLKSKEWAIEYLGPDNVVDLDIRMTAEDFAFYTHHMPACFYRLGTQGKAENTKASVHNPHFDIDPESLKVGTGMLSWLAIKSLEE
ncbi:MAG: M20 family metallopeptidase [Flavobacteriales bacterium]|nr:M20 family metallopeptidase [Flavobacteriales bacterium]